jgi:hypothetical protein
LQLYALLFSSNALSSSSVHIFGTSTINSSFSSSGVSSSSSESDDQAFFFLSRIGKLFIVGVTVVVWLLSYVLSS